MDIQALQTAVRLIEERAATAYWDFTTLSLSERSHDPMANSIEVILWQYRHSVRAVSELLSALDRAANIVARMHAVDYVGCNYRVFSQFSEREPYQSFLSLFQNLDEPEILRERVRWWLERITPTSGPSVDDTGAS